MMNDTHKKISIIYRRIVKLATGSCEGTNGLRVEQQLNLIVLRKNNTKKKKQSEMFCDVEMERSNRYFSYAVNRTRRISLKVNFCR